MGCQQRAKGAQHASAPRGAVSPRLEEVAGRPSLVVMEVIESRAGRDVKETPALASTSEPTRDAGWTAQLHRSQRGLTGLAPAQNEQRPCACLLYTSPSPRD
eukprot:5636547-Alexandrium_andersonii.AAC.2